jgi:hypothetical protein
VGWCWRVLVLVPAVLVLAVLVTPVWLAKQACQSARRGNVGTNSCEGCGHAWHNYFCIADQVHLFVTVTLCTHTLPMIS